MKCIVCDNKMNFYFSKNFNSFGLAVADYYLCNKCGFVASKTHYDMSRNEWARLNKEFHQHNNSRKDNPYHRSERYFNQGLMLFLMKRYNFFKNEPFLDWGSGIGSLSKIAKKLFDIEIVNYDPYIQPELNSVRKNQLSKKGYDLVINNATFEHFANRKILEEINSYVSSDGCLAIHTLVTEKIPKDPSWMYFLPVHCSFYTNKSMKILMKQWGYYCSVYNEIAKMWFLFKDDTKEISKKVKVINEAVNQEYLKFKVGFMDYWK